MEEESIPIPISSNSNLSEMPVPPSISRAVSSASNLSIDSSVFPDQDELHSEHDEKHDEDPIPLTQESLDQHKRAIASIAPILEDFVPVLSKSEIVSPSQDALSRTVSNVSALSISHSHPSQHVASTSGDGIEVEKRKSIEHKEPFFLE